MAKCVNKFCFCIDLKLGCILVAVYLILRGLISVLALVFSHIIEIMEHSECAFSNEGVMLFASLGVFVGPWIVYIVKKPVPRAIKNLAIWIVVYGVLDYILVLAWGSEEWGEQIYWISFLLVEIFVFTFFALNLWSYAVSVSSAPTRTSVEDATITPYNSEE